MAVLASDNFNRADAATLGANWTTQTTGSRLKVVSNQCQPGAVAGLDNTDYYSAISWPNDQYSQVTFISVSGTNDTTGIGVSVRMTGLDSTRNGYWTVVNTAASNNVSTFKLTGAAVGTLLGQSTQAFSNGDAYRIEASGSSIAVKRNGSTLSGQSFTDTSLTSGSAGLYVSTTITSGVMDDWEGGSPNPVETAPTLVGTGTAAFTATNAATITPTLPSGWAAGDIHIMIAARSDNTAMSSLTGWTNLYASNNTSAQRVEVWWRRAVAGDTDPVVTFGSGTVVRGAVIIGVRGGPSSGNPFDVTSLLANSASATVSFTDVTTTGTNRFVVAALAYEDDPTTLSTMTNYTVPGTSVFGSSLGTDMMLGYEHRTLSAAGAAGASSLTVSGGTFANSVNVGVVLPVLPDQTLLDMPEIRFRPHGIAGQAQMHQLLAQ